MLEHPCANGSESGHPLRSPALSDASDMRDMNLPPDDAPSDCAAASAAPGRRSRPCTLRRACIGGRRTVRALLAGGLRLPWSGRRGCNDVGRTSVFSQSGVGRADRAGRGQSNMRRCCRGAPKNALGAGRPSAGDATARDRAAHHSACEAVEPPRHRWRVGGQPASAAGRSMRSACRAARSRSSRACCRSCSSDDEVANVMGHEAATRCASMRASGWARDGDQPGPIEIGSALLGLGAAVTLRPTWAGSSLR